MCRIFQITSEFVLLLVAAWAFAATFEPLYSRWRAFGTRPVKRGAILGIRIAAMIAAVLCLAIIVLDVLDLAGFIHVVEGR